MRPAPALILGGGPAGAAAAITLARGGVRPLVIERTRETGDALCGGFLSWRTLEALAQLGIEADALNAQRVLRVRLFAGAHSAEAMLPRPAVGVSRRRLDALLLHRAEAEGAAIERGVIVRHVAEAEVRCDDGAALAGDAVLLATGKHDVRGMARSEVAPDPMIGLRIRLAPSATLTRLVGDAIELHLFDRGYAGCLLQEDGSVNLCLAVRRSRLREEGTPARLLQALGQESSPLNDRLADATPDQDITAIANVPYGWRARTTVLGVYRIGDQAGVIPSLAGEGMGIAIASGRAAGNAILHGIDAPQFQHGFATRLMRPIGVAAFVAGLGARTPRLLVDLARWSPSIVQRVANLTRISQSGVDGGQQGHH